MKVVVGILAAVGLLVLLLLGGCMALVGGAVGSMDTPTPSGSGSDSDTAESENPITMTAKNDGTTTDFEGQTYTVIHVAVENGSEDQEIHVNPLSFNAELADGTVLTDLGDSMFADLENPLDAVDVGPGQRAEGQIAYVGDVDVKSVTLDETFGLGETITAEVE